MGISLKGRGMIISLEGIDASGKFTQSSLLYKLLQSKGVRTAYVSFPDYTTTIGQEIRAFLSRTKDYTVEARHMLFSLNRLEHKKEIEAWLNDGDVVVINRYCDSNLAYGGASGLSIQWLRSLESEMPQANYVYYLKAKPNLSKERKTRSRDKFETNLGFLERVASVYDTLAESPNWFTIEANNSIENIHYEVSKITEELLKEYEGNEFELVGTKEKPLNIQS
jgi:dTMP kinase